MPANPRAKSLFKFIKENELSLNAIAQAAGISHGTLRAFRDIEQRTLNKNTRVLIARALHQLTKKTVDLFDLFGHSEDIDTQWAVNTVPNQFLLDRMLRDGLTSQQLAKKTGVSIKAINALLRAEMVEKEVWQKVCTYLAISPNDLGIFPKEYPWDPVTGVKGYEAVAAKYAGDLPIRKTALVDDKFLISEETIGFTIRPPSLLGNKDAYAFYMPSSHMQPRIRNGELVYVDPNRPPQIEDDVVVILMNGDDEGKAFVGKLFMHQNDHYAFATYSPERAPVYKCGDVYLLKILIGQELIAR